MALSLGVKNTFVYAVSIEQTSSEDEGLRRSSSCPSLVAPRACDDAVSEGATTVSPIACLGNWADLSDSEEQEEDPPSGLLSIGLSSFTEIGDFTPALHVTGNTPVTLKSVLDEDSERDRTPLGSKTPLSSKASAFVPMTALNSWASAFVPRSSPVVNAPKEEPYYMDDSRPNILRQKSTKPQAPTTVMLRNLPCGFTRKSLIWTLNNNGFARQYDFVYIPMDFNTRLSLGYGFVNLVDDKHVQRFIDVFDGYNQWFCHSSAKICEAMCQTQGLQANIERYRNSPVMSDVVPERFKPALFVDGTQVPFPEPTKDLPPIQKRVHKPYMP
ncbi:unnamed protein product [Prorocentrum cordatum]|uniref:Mei2-like C-terminal RNA recognition motif domain-containing protein n=1 Tax=Prorocentrum cordatum TaxID=2364126 RepID=A0ABN9XU74_9DINO|nr:unnamed protein product [Polarella glacialis]